MILLNLFLLKTMNIKTFKLFIFFCSIFYINNLFSYDLKIIGNKKYQIENLQKLTSVDLSKDLNTQEIDTILNDLYKSDLITNVEVIFDKNDVILNITEAAIINSIFFNNNTIIKDDELTNIISSKDSSLFNSSALSNDLKKIKSLYVSRGYNQASINVTSEFFSDDRINIIFDIYEGYPSKLSEINFVGSNFFSNRFLKDQINSKAIRNYNFFSNSSNFEPQIFEFDKNLLINLYKRYGFLDIQIETQITEIRNNIFNLTFFIEEGERFKISDINYQLIDESLLDIIETDKLKFEKKLMKNDYFYSEILLDDYTQSVIDVLNINNQLNYTFGYNTEIQENNVVIVFSQVQLENKLINKISISGNSITKDKTLRSKIKIEPGDYFNRTQIEKNNKELLELKYVNNSTLSFTPVSDKNVDVEINIDENKKTGNILVAGSFSGDTGLGAAFAIKDINVFGSGNEIDTTFDINSESTSFRIKYLQYLPSKYNLKNIYTILNQENDLKDSFGFKTEEQGLGYSLLFEYSDKTNISAGISINNLRGHSGINSNSSVTDNIGNFSNLTFSLSHIYDTTNDLYYPTKGFFSRTSLEISPENFSDMNFYKIVNKNDLYFQKKESEDFVFFSNNIGIADTFSGNLPTQKSFSLGGQNFKGFDYRGIGPKDDVVYLGGNKFFTSTIGYGSSFIFDKKDNVNLKIFYSLGSIWDTDYASENDFDLRSSAGVSFDFLTVIPLSISYSVPINKNNNDRLRRFNFTIGTAF